MRIAAFAVLAAFFVAFVAALSPAFAWEIKAMNDKIEKTDVIVSEICSGTVISKKYRLVLTAYHCVDGSLHEEEVKSVDPKTGEITVKRVVKRAKMFIETWQRDGFDVVSIAKHDAEIVGYDRLTDTALLQVKDKSWQPLDEAPLAPDTYDYMRGRVVYAVGNPGIEFDNSVTTGIISAPARRVDFGNDLVVPVFQHSANTIGGNSGGAIYNDDGEIIGTVTGGVRGSDISLAVPITFTKALLKKSGFGDVVKN